MDNGCGNLEVKFVEELIWLLVSNWYKSLIHAWACTLVLPACGKMRKGIIYLFPQPHFLKKQPPLTGIFLQLFTLLARDSTLPIPNKVTLHKLCIRSILTYVAPVWSNTSSYNYRRLQISQSECVRVTGNYPRRTPIPRLHTTINVTPIRDFIYHLTANFFDRFPAHPNPFARSTGNYSLADLHRQYKKYIHKRPKHILF